MTDTISSDLLYKAILSGADRTRRNREELNRINVFPVIDNDTGSNLAHTMHYILNHAKPHDSVRATLQDIARSALIGARGNSGAIFSQYFNGLYQQSAERKGISLGELASYFQEAYHRAYHAIETPVEGTVITLMRAWAVTFREALDQRKSPRELFESALARIRQSLEETKTTLRALHDLGIVDAGALGFYHFMDGFVHVVLGGAASLPDDSVRNLPAIATDIHTYELNADIPYRYCTEVLLESGTLDENALREAMHPLGDSLLLAVTDTLARVHLHTDTPWEMVRRAAAHGRILEQKAEDMVYQNLLAGPAVDATACVTDSIADLPAEYLHRHNIFQIPLNVLVGDVNYLDKVTIDGGFLAEHMDAASSAQLNTEQIRDFLTPILAHYAHVLILTVSSHMSGTHARFRDVLAEMDPDGAKAALVDTRTNSGAQGMLVREASLLIEAGLPFDRLVPAVEAMRSRAKILVSVLDLGPMVRSGRIGERVGNLLIRLGFRPIVTISPEGKGTIKGVAFSAKKNRKLLLRSLRGKPVSDYVIVHAGDTVRAESMRVDMARLTGRQPLYITDISAIVTLFAGRSAVAVAYLEKEPEGGRTA